MGGVRQGDVNAKVVLVGRGCAYFGVIGMGFLGRTGLFLLRTFWWVELVMESKSRVFN